MQGGSPPGGSGGGTFGWGGGGNGGGENSDRDMMGWVGLGSGAVNGTFDAYPNRFMSKMSSSWNEVSKQGRAYLVMFGYIMKALKPHVLPIYIPIIGLQFVSKEAAMVILGYTARICCLLAGISLVLSVVTSRVSVMNDCSAGCQMGADESAAASLSQDEDIVLSALDGITPGSSTTTAAVDTAAGENSEAPFALVTGASSGIGREIALVLASRGYSIILVGRKQGTLKKVKGDIRRITQESGRENGGVRKIRALTVVADLGEENGPEKAWEEISNRVGKVPIDIVVQNAGCYWREPVIESRTEELRQVLMVNVVGTTLLTKFAAESMAQRGCGRVLIIGSITGFLPIPTQAVYAASKVSTFSLSMYGACTCNPTLYILI